MSDEMSTARKGILFVGTCVTLLPLALSVLPGLVERLGWSSWALVGITVSLALASWLATRSERLSAEAGFVAVLALVVWSLAALESLAVATGWSDLLVLWAAVVVAIGWRLVRGRPVFAE
jgi:hypothetical protein